MSTPYDPDDTDRPDEEDEEEQESILAREAYVAHRLGGGEPATNEAFRRALEQFEQLPGAIRTGATEGLKRRQPPGPDDIEDDAEGPGGAADGPQDREDRS